MSQKFSKCPSLVSMVVDGSIKDKVENLIKDNPQWYKLFVSFTRTFGYKGFF